MTLKDVSLTCERYHKTHMFSWLIAHVLLMRVQDVLERTKEYQKRLPQIIEFCSHLNLKSLQSLIIAVACSSPGRFSEIFFRNRPEFAVYEGSLREPWRLYPEQMEATEYKGDLLIVGGAGSGKTRLFCNIGLSVLAFNKASVLVVTHSETARDQIFGEMLYQIENSQFLSSLFPPKLITHGNNKVIRCSKRGYGKIRFCLSLKGHSIWGVQIGRGGYLLLDEAALYHNDAWPAILSRARKGCRLIIGGTPCGKKGNQFERLIKGATDIKTMMLTRERDLMGGNKSKSVAFAVTRFDREKQPGWDSEQEAIAIRDYGPKDGYLYRVYVNGLVSEPEGQVFTEEHKLACFVPIPLYRTLRIVWDAKDRKVRCSVHMVMSGDVLKEILVDECAIKKFDITKWVIRNIPSVPVDVGGIDSGKLQDDHVLWGFEMTGVGLRLRWSLVTFRVPYMFQAELINGLLRHKERNLFNFGFGLEASGQTITSQIWESLIYIYEVPEEWVSPYAWKTRVILKRDDGVPERDEYRHEVTRSLKHELTVRMQDLMSNQARGILGSFELPSCDFALRTEFDEHAGRHLSGDFQYDDERDHGIEAGRVALGRYLEVSGRVEMTQASREAIEMITLPREERSKAA